MTDGKNESIKYKDNELVSVPAVYNICKINVLYTDQCACRRLQVRPVTNVIHSGWGRVTLYIAPATARDSFAVRLISAHFHFCLFPSFFFFGFLLLLRLPLRSPFFSPSIFGVKSRRVKERGILLCRLLKVGLSIPAGRVTTDFLVWASGAD